MIVVIQENRTPDNLFQQDQTLINNGANIASQGTCGHGSFPLQPDPLFTCYDTEHNHSLQGSASWTDMYDNGAMDGACKIKVSIPGGCSGSSWSCPDGNYAHCPQMAYVKNSTDPVTHHGVLQPYFEIAEQYGWANYMFQTSQGPSFPAHQFLFSGTSAPTAPTDSTECQDPKTQKYYYCYKWFDVENVNYPPPHQLPDDQDNGCISDQNAYSYDLDPFSDPESLSFTPPGLSNSAGFPCYDHQTLGDLLDNAGISWQYYARTDDGLWTAPNTVSHICGGPSYDGLCSGTIFKNHVELPTYNPNNNTGDAAPILTDIVNCNLPQVSWIIPDGNWSDHAGNSNGPGDGGPSWVGNIVNAVGTNPPCSPGTGAYSGEVYWNDTVILVVWDDWGGYYDHVPPYSIGYLDNNNPHNGAQYVYGFRVPFLIVGAYTKQQTSTNGYISNANHDFGSILNFIEYALAPQGTRLGGQYGISGQQSWPYADYFAPDYNPANPNSYSLSDFFTYGQPNPQPHPFSPIGPLHYGANCFHHPEDPPPCDFATYPLDPDSDATESD